MSTEVFPSPSILGERVWGTETLLALVRDEFSVKRLEIRAGSKGGLQYHRKKNEVAVVISGQLLIRYDLGDGVLHERIVGPGEVVHFPPGLVHQEEAITNCVIIEASTPHFNDRVRVESRYGLSDQVGLPTTTEEEIVTR